MPEVEASDYFDRLQRREILVAVDDPAGRRLAEDSGFAVVALDAVDLAEAQEAPLLVLVRHLATHDLLEDWWDETPNLWTYLSAARFDDDIEALRQANRLEPADANLAYVYAVALNSLGDPEIAIEVLKQTK